MLNVQYESDDDSSSCIEAPRLQISQALSSNYEEIKSSCEISSSLKPNVIKNESSSNGYVTEDDQGEHKKSNSSQIPSKSENSSVSLNQLVTDNQPAELEEIVKMFAHDLQQSIRQRFKNKSQHQRVSTNKKLPFEIQTKMGLANNLYAFNKFKEAIEILEDIITKMPDHAESYSTISKEMGDYEKSLNFGVMAAFLLKTDVERWQKCASIAKYLRKLPIAIYCMNRAIKQSSQSDIDEILKMKFEKISIYKMQNDFSSAIRTLQKMIKKFQTDQRRSFQLNKTLAQTFYEQGQPQKSFEVLDDLIELNLNDNNHLLDILLIYGDIAKNTNKFGEFINQMSRCTIQETIAHLKKQNEYKIKVFQIEVRNCMCKLECEQQVCLDGFFESLADFKKLNLTDKLDQYQKVVSSIVMLADRFENRINDVPNTTRIYEILLSFSLQIDQPNILYKLGVLYQKMNNYEKAKESLEQAFMRCPIIQNGQIRIELSSVYNHLGMNKKAIDILKNPYPQQQAQSLDILPQKRKHHQRAKDDEDIMLSDESDDDKQVVTSQAFVQMIESSHYPLNHLNVVNSNMVISDQSSEVSGSYSDSMMISNPIPNRSLLHDVFQKPQFDDKEFLLKRNRKLQKRMHVKKEVEIMPQIETHNKINLIKRELLQFKASSYIMLLEQCKLHLKLNEKKGLSQALDQQMAKILKNLLLRQELQDLMYKQNLKAETPEKEAFFIRKYTNSDSERDNVGKMTTQNKLKMIDEIDQFPTILNQIKPEEVIDVTFNYLKLLIEQDDFTQASDIIDILSEIELLKQIILANENMTKIFYEISTIVYFQTSQTIKAYKSLRQISNAQDMLNWAMMGTIISKNEDSSFCRSYFKRILSTKQLLNPFILMILGNNYLQKQQIDLAIKHYWLLNKSYHNKNSLLNLILAITYLSQSYQRTNEDKEQSVKRSLAFMLRYSESRDDKIEVQYNLARALQFMGLNINAKEIYESVINIQKETLNDQQRQIQIKAVYNLSQMLKGAGVSSGITIVEGAQVERIKNHNLRQAHELIMKNIIV